MRRSIQIIGCFVLSCVFAYSVAVIFITQFNIAAIIGMGYEVPIKIRFLTMLADLTGMLPFYLLLISVALMIGFLFTRYLLGRLIRPSLFLYCLAGFAALLTMHMMLETVLGLVPIAPARSLMGLLAQGFAGALGGMVFYWLTRQKNPR